MTNDETLFSSLGPRQAQSPTETTSCRPLNQRPRGGSKLICRGSADTWTSSHPDSNSTTTAPCHTTAKQVSPIVILLAKSHIYGWKLTVFFLHCRPLPRLPQPFYDHWHINTTALGEFHQHLNTLVCTMKTLSDQVTTPAETPRRVLQRRGLTGHLGAAPPQKRCLFVLAQVLQNYLRCIFIVRRKLCAVLDTFF